MALEKRGLVVLTAGSCMGFVFGSVHAFSVFLQPLEQAFGASRADVSLTYSIALVCITASVSVGYRVYGMLPAWGLVACIAGLGALGAWMAGSAGSLTEVWLGYGIVLGLANGLGYGFSLQLSAQANPGHEGFAMGVITAAYALGATVYTLWFDGIVESGSFSEAMHLMLMTVLGAGGVAAALLGVMNTCFRTAEETSTSPSISLGRT